MVWSSSSEKLHANLGTKLSSGGGLVALTAKSGVKWFSTQYFAPKSSQIFVLFFHIQEGQSVISAYAYLLLHSGFHGSSVYIIALIPDRIAPIYP